MRVLIGPALLVVHQGDAFFAAPSPSRMTTSTWRTEPEQAASAGRPRAPTAGVASLRSRQDGDADEDVEGFMSSLKSSGLFGESSGADVAGLGGRGAEGLAAAAGEAAADLEEPGKLVREAAKPFRDEMDRIEADFQRSVSEKEEEMERKLEEFMKKIDENK